MRHRVPLGSQRVAGRGRAVAAIVLVLACVGVLPMMLLLQRPVLNVYWSVYGRGHGEDMDGISKGEHPHSSSRISFPMFVRSVTRHPGIKMSSALERSGVHEESNISSQPWHKLQHLTQHVFSHIGFADVFLLINLRTKEVAPQGSTQLSCKDEDTVPDNGGKMHVLIAVVCKGQLVRHPAATCVTGFSQTPRAEQP
jgi:hypothetical protein